jgi:hypothetical protein
MVRVTVQFEQLSIGHFRHHATPPETHLAICRDLLNAGVAAQPRKMYVGSGCTAHRCRYGSGR